MPLLRLHHLWSAHIVYLCVICNSNRFHIFKFKLCTMIVHLLKMCTGKAGPEQSLVLSLTIVVSFSYGSEQNIKPIKLNFERTKESHKIH